MHETGWRFPHPATIVLVAAVAGSIAVFFGLCAYARPSTDDYIVAQIARDEGLVGSITSWYVLWTGKFAGMAFMSAFPLTCDLVADYWLAPAIVILAIFGALWALVRVATVAAGLTAVYLASVPAPHESIYWLTGAYAYQLGAAAAIALLALIAHQVPTRRAALVGNTALAALAAVGATASSETMLMPVAMITVVWCLGALAGSWRWSVRGAIVAVAILGSAAIVILAPGNEVRGAHLAEHSHRFWRSIGRSFEMGGKSLVVWSLNPALIGAAILFAPRLVGVRDRWFRGAWLPVVGYPIILASAYFPAFWAMGYPPPPRAESAVWSVFAVGWLLVVVPLAARLCRARGWVWPARLRVSIGSLLLAIGVVTADNTRAAVRDLTSGEATRFHAQAAARDALARSALARGETTVTIPRLRAHPRTLFVEDLDEFLHGFAEFHGLERVNLEPE